MRGDGGSGRLDVDVVTTQLEQDPASKPETGGKDAATASSEEDPA